MATIYALGSNGAGQLAIGHKEDVSVPKPVLFNAKKVGEISQLKAGGNHTLLLASQSLYYSGDTASGACGANTDLHKLSSGFEQISYSFEDLNYTPQVALCAATWESSVVVLKDENGKSTKVYTFGTGNKGELGLGQFLFKSSKAQLLKDFPPTGLEIVDLAASVSHVVAVLSNGEVYGWGSGRKGQLGHVDSIVYQPRLVSGIDFKVVRAVCGREFTYLVGDTSTGQHCILGSDKWDMKATAPSDVRGWKDIGATWGSIFVLLENGKLVSWGRNDHGQLAPADIPILQKIAIGSEHALGLTADGNVLAWGWGEHGNCGPSTVDGDVKGTWNVIASSKYLPAESKITAIGAGCATSWICIS